MSNKENTPAYITLKGEKGIARYNEFEQFRKNFAMLRAHKGDTGEEFAKALNLKSTKRAFDFECGRCRPSFDEIRTIAKYFEVTIDELMYKKGKIIFELI
jgi:transcriptional regulator with XRE-family HTH domain